MEYRSYSSVESRGRVSPQGKEKKKLGSIFKLDKLTYEDFHPEVVLKHMDSHLPKPKGSQQKQVERNCSMSEELVKYMSNLPSYLERGEYPQEKAFNLGVLDWRVLEKWQKHNYNADISQTNGKNSHLRNYSSSFISSGGSSSRCSRGQSWSPQRQKLNQYHVNAHVSEGCSTSSTSPFSRDSERFQDCENGLINPSNAGRSMSMATQSSHMETAECNDKGTGRQTRHEIISPPVKSSGITFMCGSKGKEVNHHSETVSARKSLQATSYRTVSSFERQKTNDDDQGTGNRCQSGSSKGNDHHASVEADHYGRGSSAADFPFDYTLAKDLLPVEEHITSRGNVTASPARGKNVEMKSSSSIPRKLADEEIPQSKMWESVKAGNNSSANRRFSFGLGRMGKKNVASALKISVSEDIPDSKITSTSGNSTCEKPNVNSRSRSSPVRRLLNPLLKPKNCESNNLAKSIKLSDPSTTDKSLNSTCKLGEAPLKVMLELQRDKNGSSRIQALLQVAVKNGLPLFTFTVHNCSDILVATFKESSLPRQGAHEWVYSFFSISEMQKKNTHWMNKGSKDRHQTYVSNVAAQMRVSAVQFTDTGRNRSAAIKSGVREFVLTSMGTDSVPNDELAAVIVKFPENCSDSEEGNFNAMVILPGGDHGVPRKGDPSSLIERWRSGGSCDCGGWDLGCRIRTLANNHQSCQRLDSDMPESSTFKLFSQDAVEENSKPLFILSPFKDGIISVEFHSSIQLIQAFSIGIAILNSSRKDDVFIDAASENSKFTNRAADEISADYVWNPPLSPFGRV